MLKNSKSEKDFMTSTNESNNTANTTENVTAHEEWPDIREIEGLFKACVFMQIQMLTAMPDLP